MSRRLVPAVVAVAALALVGFPRTADAGSAKTCFGHEPTVVGTGGDDDIYLNAGEAGVFVRINGKTWRDRSPGAIAIVAGAGDDKITFKSDGGGFASICSGRGDDDLDVTMIDRVSTGAGKDRVKLFLQCNVNPDIYGAETVRVTGFDSVEEGPCN